MPELLEKEVVQETTEEPTEKEYTDEDLLNRQPFIDKVKTIIELQAAQKKNCCFAINGSWGVGKTFVLDKLEEQLELETNVTDKYLIFRYNCWQYDYYEEPLVAIVSSMLDTIDEKVNLIPEGTKKALLEKAKGLLKIVGSALLVKANDEIKEKTGVDIEKLAEFVSDTNDILSQGTDDIKTFDSNFLFKKTLIKLQQTLQILSKEKTIIFVVDELDRCLPEYAIKVLERLHHVFEDVSNVQTILSIDKSQLEHIVKTTFGVDTLTEKYLSKFIQFYLNLDEGTLNDEFDSRFGYYISNFVYSNENTQPYEIDEYKIRIFDGIDMRSRIEIIDKCNLLHRLLNSEKEKLDYSIMCIEIFLVLANFLGLDKKVKSFSSSELFHNVEKLPLGMKYLSEKYKTEHTSGLLLVAHDNISNTILRTNNIIGLLTATYRIIVGFTDDRYKQAYDTYGFTNIKRYVQEFYNLLQIIN